MLQQRPRTDGDASMRRSDEDHYVFDNAGTQTPSRFSALASIFDPGSIRCLTQLGLGQGWSCLEAGSGGGSIASWLCDRVGPNGRVVATDIDTRFLETLNKSNLEVRRHDIVSNPLPEAAFDLVHTRLVLMHLPGREKALGKLVAALRPGGWLMAEEFDSLSVRPDPDVNPAEVSLKTFAVMQRVMIDRGVDLRYGRALVGRLRAHGLAHVASEGRTFMWHGGSPATEMYRANIEQLRGPMIESGLITQKEIDRDLARMDDENFLVPSPIMWAAWGRKPVSDLPAALPLASGR